MLISLNILRGVQLHRQQTALALPQFTLRTPINIGSLNEGRPVIDSLAQHVTVDLAMGHCRIKRTFVSK